MKNIFEYFKKLCERLFSFRNNSVAYLLKVLGVKNFVDADLDYGIMPIDLDALDQTIIRRKGLEMTHVTPISAPQCRYIRINLRGERFALLWARWDDIEKTYFITTKNESNRFVATEQIYPIKELVQKYLDGFITLTE